MRHNWLGLLLSGWVLGAQAQWPSEQERQAQSALLDARRQALEDTYNHDMRLCYQQFNVTNCQLLARDRRIEANAQLRKDELAHKDLERHINTEQAHLRMAERASEQQVRQKERELAVQETQDRAQRRADKLVEHEAQGNKRSAFEQKQREAQAHRDKLEQKRRERASPPAAPLPAPVASR